MLESVARASPMLEAMYGFGTPQLLNAASI